MYLCLYWIKWNHERQEPPIKRAESDQSFWLLEHGAGLRSNNSFGVCVCHKCVTHSHTDRHTHTHGHSLLSLLRQLFPPFFSSVSFFGFFYFVLGSKLGSEQRTRTRKRTDKPRYGHTGSQVTQHAINISCHPSNLNLKSIKHPTKSNTDSLSVGNGRTHGGEALWGGEGRKAGRERRSGGCCGQRSKSHDLRARRLPEEEEEEEEERFIILFTPT